MELLYNIRYCSMNNISLKMIILENTLIINKNVFMKAKVDALNLLCDIQHRFISSFNITYIIAISSLFILISIVIYTFFML